jgi:hypothetical protein
MSDALAKRVTEYLKGEWSRRRNHGLAPGPGHSKHDRSLSIKRHSTNPDDVVLYSFAGDDVLAIKDDLRRAGVLPARSFGPAAVSDPVARTIAAARKAEAEAEADKEEAARIEEQQRKALTLWRRSSPIEGTIAERYLREVRGITCPLPPTLSFLAATPKYPHPKLIAAFGIGPEIEPGLVTIPELITAVHCTALLADGSGKAPIEPQRFILGPAKGSPIVLAPVSDSLGLLIGEGIETTLWGHQPSGLGAWAAGSATLLPWLVSSVPSYFECVTIAVDADPAGRRRAQLLAEGLAARGIEVLLAEAGRGR